jgi:hypothetical protein
VGKRAAEVDHFHRRILHARVVRDGATSAAPRERENVGEFEQEDAKAGSRNHRNLLVSM